MNEVDREARGLAPPLYGVLLLPSGMAGGFVTVTLAFILAHRGVSVSAIAGLVGLSILPNTWQIVVGPVVDASLTSRRWCLIGSIGVAACLVALAFAPLDAAAMPLLAALAFTASACGVIVGVSAMAAMAVTTPEAKRGAVAAWTQTANLGGGGLGGGLGLWISTHAGGPSAAALWLAALSVVCAAPLLWLRPPPKAVPTRLAPRLLGLLAEVVALFRTRQGALVMILVTLPAALGASLGLMAAVAGEWRASADLVALVKGAFGGLASVPGCIIGGYLCDRFPRRTVYVWAALVFAAVEAAMALAPHTPAAFAVFVLLGALFLGVGYGAYSAVIYECLGGKGAATVVSLLSSLGNLPLVLGTFLVGWVETRYGASAMLLSEAALGAVSILGYVALAAIWRPVAAPMAAIAAAE